MATHQTDTGKDQNSTRASTFIGMFRRLMGVTPDEFRKETLVPLNSVMTMNKED